MEFTTAMKAPFAKDFQTHLNYAHCMVGMMYKLEVSIPIDTTATIDIASVRRFQKLANLTKQSIDGEVENCKVEPDYVQIAAPWFAVKCYYRIYYLESILIHLSRGNSEVFKNSGHTYVRKTIRAFCKVAYFKSHFKKAEIVVSCDSALSFKTVSGMNIKKDYYLTDDCINSIRRKLAVYAVDHWKKNSGFANFRSARAIASLRIYKSKSEISLFDYFYHMRVKANYRDSDFLDFDKILASEGVKYIGYLKQATDRYCNILQENIDRAASARSISIK